MLTQHNDNGRTGVNPAETLLNTTNVKPDTFGRLWTLYVDGQVVAQPLYVSQLRVDTSTNPNTPLVRGTFNAVVVATMHNTVYVYDADAENRLPDGKTRPLWATWLGPPRPGGKDIDMWSTNDPEWGIAGTPVIDPQKSTLWVVAWHAEDGTFRYRLHALNLKDGAERQPSVQIGGAAPDAAQPCAYPSGYNPCHQKQRPALLLSNGVIYVAFGGDGSRGAVFAYDAATLQQVAFWASTPTGNDGGIWQSGQGPAADADGNVYLMTGNGTFDAATGGANYGDSFVKLRLENGALVVKDYFTPCNERFLSGIDLDLGSGGPVLVPGTNLLAGRRQAGYRLPAVAHQHGQVRGEPDGAGLQEPERRAGVPGHRPARTRGRHDLGPHPRLAGGVDGTGSRARLRLGRERHAEGLQALERQVRRDRPAAQEHLSSAATACRAACCRCPATARRREPASSGPSCRWTATPTWRAASRASCWRSMRRMCGASSGPASSRVRATASGCSPSSRRRPWRAARSSSPPMATARRRACTAGTPGPQQFPARYYVAVYGLLPHPPHLKPIVNQSRGDVTVTSATATDALTLTTDTCPPADPGNVDCTAALAAQFGAPSLHTLIVPAGFDFAGCNLLRVVTVSKKTALSRRDGHRLVQRGGHRREPGHELRAASCRRRSSKRSAPRA